MGMNVVVHIGVFSTPHRNPVSASVRSDVRFQVLLQLGDQICVFDPVSHKIGLLTIGHGPIVRVDGRPDDERKRVNVLDLLLPMHHNDALMMHRRS